MCNLCLPHMQLHTTATAASPKLTAFILPEYQGRESDGLCRSSTAGRKRSDKVILLASEGVIGAVCMRGRGAVAHQIKVC